MILQYQSNIDHELKDAFDYLDPFTFPIQVSVGEKFFIVIMIIITSFLCLELPIFFPSMFCSQDLDIRQLLESMPFFHNF